MRNRRLMRSLLLVRRPHHELKRGRRARLASSQRPMRNRRLASSQPLARSLLLTHNRRLVHRRHRGLRACPGHNLLHMRNRQLVRRQHREHSQPLARLREKKKGNRREG
jgi:hypothetical protein